MAIKHLKWYSRSELKKINPDVPIWQRREILRSPLIILVMLGFMVYGILLLFKWLVISWIYPFFNWTGFCKIGYHKYRRKGNFGKEHICRVCGKIIDID